MLKTRDCEFWASSRLGDEVWGTAEAYRWCSQHRHLLITIDELVMRPELPDTIIVEFGARDHITPWATKISPIKRIFDASRPT